MGVRLVAGARGACAALRETHPPDWEVTKRGTHLERMGLGAAADFTGVWQWNLSLAPGEVRVIRAAMSLNMPADAGGTPLCDPDCNGGGNIDQDDYRALVDVVAGGPCP
jgi:hypothetical protein